MSGRGHHGWGAGDRVRDGGRVGQGRPCRRDRRHRPRGGRGRSGASACGRPVRAERSDRRRRPRECGGDGPNAVGTARSNRRAGEQRRDRRACCAPPRGDGAGVGHADRHRSQERLSLLPRGVAAHARAAARGHHQRRIRGRQRGQPQHGAILHREGGHHRAHEGGGQGGRAARRPRERRRARDSGNGHSQDPVAGSDRLHEEQDPDGTLLPRGGDRGGHRIPGFRQGELRDGSDLRREARLVGSQESRRARRALPPSGRVAAGRSS